MNIIRRHPYLISLAALLVILPVPVFAVGEELVLDLVTVVFGLFVRLAAMLLNFSINHFVIDFGGVYANTGVGYAVDTTWIIIRDFVNMGFIFGFVYIGFKMILNSNDSNTRRWLVNILLAALLVNFSLFITKFVVDFSNQIAAQIVVNGLGGEYTTNSSTGLAEVDLGQSFMDRMGITSIWENPVTGVGWGYIFGSALLFMITTFVFAAGGILLIIRFAMLNLFLVLSPLMFLSWILPGLRDTMNRYWSGFLGRAFFAPVYFLFIYFSLQIISGLQVAVSSGPGSNLANPSWAGTFGAVEAGGARNIQESTLGTVPFFVLICVFMIASLVIAQKMGADGGDRAVAIGKQLRNKVQRGMTRAATKPVRYGGGLAARGISNAAGGALETQLRRAQQLQGDSMLTRATRKVARLNAVQGAVGGAAESMQKAKFGLSRTASEEKKMRQQTETRSNNSMDITTGLNSQELLDAVKKGKITVNGQEEDLATMTEARKKELGLDGLMSQDENTRKEAEKKHEDQATKMQRVASEMSIKDFEAMSESEQEKIAAYISGPLSESVMKSDNISEKQKGVIGEAQKKAIQDTIESNGEILTEKIASLSIRQIEAMGDDFITQYAAHFTDSQFSDIKKSKKFTEGQTGRFVGKRKEALKEMVKDEATAEKAFTQTHYDDATRTVKSKSRKSSEIAKLPGEVLASVNSTRYITVDVLKAIASGDKDFERVSTADREAIERNIKDAYNRTLGNDPTIKKAFDYLKSSQGQERFLGQN